MAYVSFICKLVYLSEQELDSKSFPRMVVGVCNHADRVLDLSTVGF